MVKWACTYHTVLGEGGGYVAWWSFGTLVFDGKILPVER